MKKCVLVLILAMTLIAACGRSSTPAPAPTEPPATAEPTPTEAPPTTEPNQVQAAFDPADVMGILWQWVELTATEPAGQSVVPDPENYTLSLMPDGVASVKADCNRVSWPYTLEGSALTFDALFATTLAMCGPDSLYEQYLNLLGNGGMVSLENGRFVLELREDAGRMVFDNAGSAEAAVVTGRVVADGNPTLPAGAMLEVRVEDVSLADAPATQIGGQIQEIASFPANFEAPYESQQVDPRHTYGLTVRVSDASGSLLYINTQAYNVLTQGNPTNDVEVLVEPVGGASSTDGELLGKWQWVRSSYNDDTGVEVDDPSRYTVEFRADGTLGIQADCNNLSWTYTREGNNLTISSFGPTTLASCPPGSLDQKFLKDLSEVSGYVMHEGNLVLNLMADAGNMIFAREGMSESGAAGGPSATAEPTQPLAYTPKLEERPCQAYNPAVGEAEGDTYWCGAMIVPQDRQQPDGKQIEIKYAILKSQSDTPRLDPMLFLSGGPGNSALHPDGFVELANRFGPMRQERDIILFDQRGVGASSPPIECAVVPVVQDEARKAELLERYKQSTGVEPTADDQFTVDCVLGLWDQGVDVAHYTSVDSAADTVDLMRALREAYGYEGYNLYGISYGTRLAETIARDYPDLGLVRTLVLDSVFPRPVGEFDAAYFIGKHEMFESVFEACAADSICSGAYPDLQERFLALAAKLNAETIQLPDETTLSGDQLYQFMYPFEDRGPDWVGRIPYLPLMISELEAGTTDTYIGLRDGTLPPREPTPDIPDTVYDVMDGLGNCTAVSDQDKQNDLYRQMYNVTRERAAEIVNTLCTPAQAAPLLEKLETMSPDEANEVVKRLYIAPARSSSPTVRTVFNCTEGLPFGETAETVENKMREAGMPQFLIDEAVSNVQKGIQVCGLWPTVELPPSENEPVSTDRRALLLNGQWDYVTYPKWAGAVHSRWPNSDYLFVPQAMHSLLSNYGPCPTDVTLQFLNDPSATLDSSCTEGMEIQWALPAQ